MHALELTTALTAAESTLTTDTGGGEATMFWILAPLMVLGGLGLIFARKAVHSALCMGFVMICLAFLYTAQGAPFLGTVQVVVYTGAVMMLFLFVLMLVGIDTADSLVETIKGQRWVGLLAGLGLGAVLVGVIVQATLPPATGLEEANQASNPVGIAELIFGNYVFAMELVGALLITAALGALMLAHRVRLTPKIKQGDRAEARVATGAGVVSLPAPGVFARHNANDVPALDPYGNPIESSVSRVLRIRGQERSVSEFQVDIPLLEGGGAVKASLDGAADEAETLAVDPLADEVALAELEESAIVEGYAIDLDEAEPAADVDLTKDETDEPAEESVPDETPAADKASDADNEGEERS